MPDSDKREEKKLLFLQISTTIIFTGSISKKKLVIVTFVRTWKKKALFVSYGIKITKFYKTSRVLLHFD